jgi:hypothetical protein
MTGEERALLRANYNFLCWTIRTDLSNCPVFELHTFRFHEYLITDSMGTNAGMGAAAKSISYPARNGTPISESPNPYSSLYTNWGIPNMTSLSNVHLGP